MDEAVAAAYGWDVRPFDLAVETVQVTLAGSGSIEVNASDSIDGSLTGSGTITHTGDAEVHVSRTGSGSVRQR